MAVYCLRIEGVNFDATLYDTNDLSVIRGASLLLEGVAEYCVGKFRADGMKGITQIYGGASQAGFDVGSDFAQANRAKEVVLKALNLPPYCHLSFVVDLGQGDTPDVALDAAEQLNRISQYRQWTIPDSHVDGAVRQDALDGVRGATQSDDLKGLLSPSTYARLLHGREFREKFFYQGGTDNSLLRGVEFCNSFQDLVENPPAGTSRSAQNKIAVIHLDGDNFGQTARAVGTEKFADALGQKFAKIRRRIVDDALKAERQEKDGDAPRLRLEVLVWGGDDITIVVPAWRAFLFLAGFYDVVKDWSIDGNALGFTAGVVIANVKTPIRSLTLLADTAVNISKNNNARGSVTFDVFESVTLPAPNQFEGHRRCYSNGLSSPETLGFPGGQIAELAGQLMAWKDEAGGALPGRSQLYKLLADAPEEMTHDNLSDYCERVLPGARLSSDMLTLPSRGGHDRGLRENLYWITQLWDYATCLDDRSG